MVALRLDASLVEIADTLARGGHSRLPVYRKSLDDIVPRPDHKATGEERAWSRRLAKRFGAEGRIDDRTFVLKGDGNRPPGVDFESLKPDAIKAEVRAFFDPVDADRGDALIGFGWAMAEDLASLL